MKKTEFGRIGEKIVWTYTLEDAGMAVSVLDYGAIVQSIVVGGTDVCLGFNDLRSYLDDRAYCCCVVGRVANRIKDGKFRIGKKEYRLTQNEGTTHLHGGAVGFGKKFYSAEEVENGVKMTYISPDGEEGYPGKMTFSVTFKVKDRALLIEYEAESDRETLFAPTSHLYFNLNGEGSGKATENVLTIYADGYTPIDDKLLPTGEVLPVEGTVFDFRMGEKAEGELTRKELQAISGYDHNFVLNGEHAFTLYGERTGIKTDAYTDMPCLQFYSGIADMGVRGKSKLYSSKEGIALEPQFAPNSINIDGFKKPVLPAGKTVKHYIKLKFSF